MLSGLFGGILNWGYDYKAGPIERLFTYESFEGDPDSPGGYILHTDGSATLGLRYRPIGLTATPNDIIRKSIQGIKDSFPPFEEGELANRIQFQIMFRRDQYMPQLRDDFDELKEYAAEKANNERVERAVDMVEQQRQMIMDMAHDGVLYEDEYYIFITYNMTEQESYWTKVRNMVKGAGKILTDDAVQDIRDKTATKLATLEEVYQRLIQELNSDPFGGAKGLSANDLFKTLQNFLNPASERPRPYEGSYEADGSTERMARDTFDFSPDDQNAHIQCGREAWSLFRMSEKPNRFEPGMVNQLTTIPMPFRMVLSFRFMKETEAHGRAKSTLKSAQMLANRQTDDEGNLTGDKVFWFLEDNHQAIKAYEDAQAFRKRLRSSHEKTFACEFDMRFVVRQPPNSRELNTFRKQVRDIQADVRPVEHYGRKFEFLSTLPGMEKFPRENIEMFENVVNMVPMTGGVRNEDARPIFVMPNSYGSYTKYDPFDRQGDQNNWHKFVVGTSGGGKSVFNSFKNYMYYLYEDALIYIVEAGDSAKNYVEGLGGEYMTLGQADSPTINPLFGLYDPPDMEDEEALQDFLFRQRNLNIQIISSLCFKDNREAIARHRNVIGQAIRIAVEAGKNRGTEPTYSVVYKVLTDVIPDQGNEKTVERAKEVADRFAEYVGTGIYADILDGKNEIPLDENPMGFNVENILQDRVIRDEVFTLIIQMINSNVPRYRKERVAFIDLDEYHAYAKNEQTKDDVSYSVRTYRKLGAACTVLTQGPGDFDDELGKVFLDNCKDQLYFALGRGCEDELKGLHDFNDKEIRRAMDNKVVPGSYSKLLIRCPWGTEQCRLHIPEKTMELFETDFRMVSDDDEVADESAAEKGETEDLDPTGESLGAEAEAEAES